MADYDPTIDFNASPSQTPGYDAQRSTTARQRHAAKKSDRVVFIMFAFWALVVMTAGAIELWGN